MLDDRHMVGDSVNLELESNEILFWQIFLIQFSIFRKYIGLIYGKFVLCDLAFNSLYVSVKLFHSRILRL